MADDKVSEPTVEPSAISSVITPLIVVPTLGVIVEALENIVGDLPILPSPQSN